VAVPEARNIELPNLERGAKLLNDPERLWAHPGVSDQQREDLVREVFTHITMTGTSVAAIEPKAMYVPLFATLVLDQFGYQEPGSPPMLL